MREHGTHACYVWGPEPGCLPGRGCRCTACSLARGDYEAKRKQQAEPPYVAAGPVREHIEFLATQGVGLKQIAKVSGISHGALWKLVYGVSPSRNRKARPPSKRCRATTAEAILAVTPSASADGSRVDAGPTWQIIRRLLAAGWTKSAIGRAIGQARALQLGTTTITRANARAIAALEGQPPPDDVGKAWATHYVDTIVDDESTQAVVYDDRDRITLRLVELLEARIDQRHWRAHAACLGKPTWMFFPTRGDHKTVQAAKAVCATCPVQAECLAAHRTEREGIYGGTSARERRPKEPAA